MTIDDAQETFHTAMNELRDAIRQPVPSPDEGYIAFENPDSKINTDELGFKGRKRRASSFRDPGEPT